MGWSTTTRDLADRARIVIRVSSRISNLNTLALLVARLVTVVVALINYIWITTTQPVNFEGGFVEIAMLGWACSGTHEKESNEL